MIDLKNTLRVMPIHVVPSRSDRESAVHIGEELEQLIETFGGKIVDRVLQRLDRPDNRTYIGKGKVAEVLERITKHTIDIIVLNAMAKPGQVFELKKQLQKANPNIEVWDRVDLVLHIFDKHAVTTEAKLQIELARMRYMGPRIYGMGYVMSRQGGGIGTSGVGETNTELMKRHWREEVKRISNQLEKISKAKEDHLQKRRRAGFKTVSIVGYTNAGKSSLFNALTGKHQLEKNELFATLDSSVGKLYIPASHTEVLLTDTIGFIRNLPPRLISAFKSTLMESIHADILLHVIDVSDPELGVKIQVVQDILRDLGRDTRGVMYVFNKADKVHHVAKEELVAAYKDFTPLFVSAKTHIGMQEIVHAIELQLSPDTVSPVVS